MPPVLDLLLDILLSILIPALFASSITFLILLRWNMAGLALLAGLLTANYFRKVLSWSWQDDLGLFFIMLAVASVVSTIHVRNWCSKILVVLSVIAITAILLVSEGVPGLHIVIVVTLSLLQFSAIHEAEQRMASGIPAVLLALTGLAAAMVLIHAHTARLFDLSLIWMASAFGLGVIALLCNASAGSLALPAAVFFPFLLYYGQQNTFSEVPWFCYVCLAVAPLASFLLLFGKTQRLTVILWLSLLALSVLCAMRYESVVIL